MKEGVDSRDPLFLRRRHSHLHSLASDPRVRAALASLSFQNRTGESAERFLSFFPATGRLGVDLIQPLGSELGIGNVSKESYTIPLPATAACLSLCVEPFGRGIAITRIGEGDDKPQYVVLGTVPSSWLHWQGTGEAPISQEHDVGAAGRIYITGRDCATVVLRHDRENATLALKDLTPVFPSTGRRFKTEGFGPNNQFLNTRRPRRLPRKPRPKTTRATEPGSGTVAVPMTSSSAYPV